MQPCSNPQRRAATPNYSNGKKQFVQCRTNRYPYYYEHAYKHYTICKQALYEQADKHQHKLLFMYKPIASLLQT